MNLRIRDIKRALIACFVILCPMGQALASPLVISETIISPDFPIINKSGRKCKIEKNKVHSIRGYAHWINNLENYRVRQGNAFLMVQSTFPLFLDTFGSCFGNNPASPYIIPQPPVEDSYVDPYYGVPLNTPGPHGSTTNIFYRLSDHDALVTIVSYPPLAAYFGYQSYVFTRRTSFYKDIRAPYPRKISPDPKRYEIFGSIGNDINNVIVQNQYGFPWNRRVVMYITTSNSEIANDLIAKAMSEGINAKSIFVEPIGSNVITGNGRTDDDMITLLRYAVPQSSSDGNAWMNNLSENVLVYKVTNNHIPVDRFGANSYTRHVVNHDEKSLARALNQLATILQSYLASAQSSPATIKSTTALSTDSLRGVPKKGLVGSYGIAKGTLCQGDNQDTSTYAALTLANIGAEETAFIIGVNHNVRALNNSHYISVDIYETEILTGIAGISQTNPRATGFDSGLLTGSVETVLSLLGITIPPENIELIENADKLYLTFMARDINNPTIAAASAYGINLMGTSLVPAGQPISIAERSYVVPERTAGGNINFMVYPIIIAATTNFIP